MKPSPSLSLTAGIQSFPSTIDEWVVGHSYRNQRRCILAYSTDLHQVLCQIEMPQLCGMCKTTILDHVGMMVRVERTKQVSYIHRFTWSHDCGKVENLQEISSWCTGK